MPTYEYGCSNGHTFEVEQRITEEPLKRCKVCKAKVQRLLSAPRFILKGGGWYSDGYSGGGSSGSKGDGGKGGSSESSGSSSKSEGSGSSKSEGSGSSKSESKSDSKAGSGDSTPAAAKTTAA